MHQKIRLWTCVQLFRSIFKYIRFSYYSDKEMYCVCFSLINVLSSLQIVSHFFGVYSSFKAILICIHFRDILVFRIWYLILPPIPNSMGINNEVSAKICTQNLNTVRNRQVWLYCVTQEKMNTFLHLFPQIWLWKIICRV